MTRVFVLGLDGGSWLLAEPWIEAGMLPNLAKLRESGVFATSRSCLPPVTYPNWKCYSTGKNPGKFGVYWWERIDFQAEEISIMSGSDYRSAELWDYLNAAGLTTGIVNMPSMYPPRELDGVVVSGGPDAVEGEYRSLDAGYTFPPAFEEELQKRYDYRIHPQPLLSSDTERGDEVEEILSLLDLRLRVARDLFVEEELDFVHVTLFYLNVLHHFFWDAEPTHRAWQLVDDWLGELSNLDVNLIIMSDHGSAPTTTEFYINEWLSQNDYLKRRVGVDDYLKRLGFTRESVLALAKRFNIVEMLAAVVPESIQSLVPQDAGAKRERKMKLIQPDKTKALASGQGPVYLNPRFENKVLRGELIHDLKGVTDAEDKPLFHGVHPAEEVYEGEYLDIGPDIVIDQRPGVHINDGMGGGVVQSKPDRWAAENTRSGIFVANGPGFSAGNNLGEISILDIMPTILASYGVDLPDDVDGNILDVFEDQPSVGCQRPIEYDAIVASDPDDEVTERLQQLGYME